MSPEQWRGEKVDGRADQYALGVLAFELLTGRRPFAGYSMQELLRAHLQDDAPEIISFRDDLPPAVAVATRRAMAKDPAAAVAKPAPAGPRRSRNRRPPARGARCSRGSCSS
jgi:serine/threonine-protein kinase